MFILAIIIMVTKVSYAYAKKDGKADESDLNGIIVYMNNGNCITYHFDQNPTIYYSSDDILFHTNSSSVTYKWDELNYFKFIQIESAVGDWKMPNYVIRRNGKTISIDGIEEEDVINVVNAKGQQYNKSIDIEFPKAIIDLNSVPSGIYIIKVNNSVNFKMLVK